MLELKLTYNEMVDIEDADRVHGHNNSRAVADAAAAKAAWAIVDWLQSRNLSEIKAESLATELFTSGIPRPEVKS